MDLITARSLRQGHPLKQGLLMNSLELRVYPNVDPNYSITTIQAPGFLDLIVERLADSGTLVTPPQKFCNSIFPPFYRNSTAAAGAMPAIPHSSVAATINQVTSEFHSRERPPSQ